MDSFSGAANDNHFRISMRREIPGHVKSEWNIKRAEAARDLANRIDRSYASLQEAVTCTEGPIMQKIPLASGLLDRSGCLVPNVKGINPLRFHSTHPVWGKHAFAVEKSADTKVGSYFCKYCYNKELVGNANDVINHMKKGCKIPLHILMGLLEEVDQFKERSEKLRSAKTESKAKGGKVRTENCSVAILKKSDVGKIAELVAELSLSEEYHSLDGTTGVLAMSQSLLMQVQKHLCDETERIKIAEYYEMASRIACDNLDHIAERSIFSAIDQKPLVSTCMAALSMKIVDSYKRAIANVAVEAVCSVTDWERKDVNLKLIQVKGKVGRKKTAELVHGIVIDKHMSSQQMPKTIKGAKIALLLFEPSNIDTVEVSKHDDQQKYIEEVIQKYIMFYRQKIGATLVICKWSFDEKASEFLMERKLTAVRGVSDAELKEIANATGGQIVLKIQDLSLDKLGKAKLVREKQIGKTKGRVLYIESYAIPAPVTIFVHDGSNVALEETMRKIADALCVLRSLIIDDAFVFGGGSAEISCSLALEAAADTYPGYARPFIKSFAHALDTVPLKVAENCGVLPIDILTTLKSHHLKEKNSYFGIDCNSHGIANMKERNVFASLKGKKKQMLLALDVIKIMLKEDGVT